MPGGWPTSMAKPLRHSAGQQAICSECVALPVGVALPIASTARAMCNLTRGGCAGAMVRTIGRCSSAWRAPGAWPCFAVRPYGSWRGEADERGSPLCRTDNARAHAECAKAGLAMGRWQKSVTEAWAAIALTVEAQRQWAAHAATLPDDEKRKLFREWWAQAAAAEAAGRYVPRFPTYLRGLTCGTIKRDGRPCGSKTLCANGRCKFHGGASTGPTSPEGRARALANLKLGRGKRGNS